MDCITRLRIRNVRAFEYADVDISPLTVLVGENGSGKSTIIECLELLHKTADPSFFQQFYTIHRGMSGLLRKGATFFGLGVVIEDTQGQQPRIEYEFALAPQHSGAAVQSEHLLVGSVDGTIKPLQVITRTLAKGEMFDQKKGQLVPVPQEAMGTEQLILSSFGAISPHPAVSRLLSMFRRMEIHLGLDTLASWAAQSVGRAVQIRNSTMLLPTERLALLGHNLANAWSALKNFSEAHWRHTMALVRLGLGDTVDSIRVVPDAGGGNIGLALYRSDLPDPIPASSLSDGQLAWLGFVAIARLNPKRSLLAVDEPELHLHPSLLGRVVALLANLESKAPVVLSTHSDRVLELLDDPANTVRVCALEGSKAVVMKLDATELPRWLEQFGDLGQLRTSGYLHRVLLPMPKAADTIKPIPR